jgi:glutamate racemase
VQQQAIAILDSGVGGLTVAKEIMRQLPQEKIVYFGDTARTPYGPRSNEEIIKFTREIVNYLMHFRPKMIVIACNTATAVALEDIRSSIMIPVVGVIHPGARAAIKKSRCGNIGVIGTEGTIRSGAYEQALAQLAPNINVYSKACPQFVPLVERGLYHKQSTREIVSEALQSLKDKPIDCLILGCTHYPFLSDMISEAMGPGVDLISSAEETAREISAILHHKGQLARTDKCPIHQFFCSGDPEMFQHIAEEWLNEEVSVTPVVWRVPKIV